MYTPDGVLNFGAPYTPDGVLQFGETVSQDYVVDIAATITPPTVVVAIELTYNSFVWRGISNSFGDRFRSGKQTPVTNSMFGRTGLQAASSITTAALDAKQTFEVLNLTSVKGIPKLNTVNQLHKDGIIKSRIYSAIWFNAVNANHNVRTSWFDGIKLNQVNTATYQHLRRAHQVVSLPWIPPVKASKDYTSWYTVTQSRRQSATLYHDDGIFWPGKLHYTIPVIPTIPLYDFNGDLVFCPITDSSVLRFIEPPCSYSNIVVPVRRVYFVQNSFSLIRVLDSVPIHVYSFEISTDASSWTWSWSATISGAQLDQVISTDVEVPIELIATLNGTQFYLLAESLNRDRSFGQSNLKISGRGRSALLAAPYAWIESRTNTGQVTANQLAESVLTINGQSLGWSVNWQLIDWLIPANAFVHNGTYIEALTRIAEAGGGYLQSHPYTETVIFKPYYPYLPWTLDSQVADFGLPDSVVTVEGIEWINKPLYDHVWIAGGSGGRLDRVTRTGLGNQLAAPTVVDELAVATEMTRQRGIRVLGDTARKANVTLKLPLLVETGIIQPGDTVQYSLIGTLKIGVVRSVSVSYSYPTAWQTINVETHYESV